MANMKSAHNGRARAASRPSLPLAGVDLNLLVALDALLCERNVTRAAARLGTSQSALSHILARLRQLFGDPLLVRTPRSMLPTALALELAAPLRATLAELEETVRLRPRFSPRSSQRQFTVASADFATLVLFPELLRRVSQAAPSISLAVQPASTSSIEQLAAGQLDLVLTASPPNLPDVLARRLVDERIVCLVRRDHPTVGESLSLDEYVALSHILISPVGGGPTLIDPQLEQMGRRRHIALRIPHFLAAPLIVAETDLILTVPSRVARLLGPSLKVRAVTPPIALPGFTISMCWHRQRSHDPGHRWLRDQLIATGAARQTG